jgi:hypothetical protein
MRSLLIRLYPARWRARYGDEFEAILEARPLGPYDVADILLGALDAQLRLRGRGAGIREGRGFPMSLRIGGIAAIVGAALWTVGIVLATEAFVHLDRTVPAIVLLTGTAAMLVGLAGLSAFQARTHPVLAWAAFLVPAAGMIAIVVGFSEVLGENSWYLFMAGTVVTWLGFILFAIVTYLTAVLSREAAALVGAGITVPVLILAVGGAIGIEPGGTWGSALLVVAAACTLIGWFALGIQAIRLDRPSTGAQPA